MSLFKKKKEKLELEVSEKHVGLRVVLAAGFLVLGLGALSFFLIGLLSEDPGWQTIEPSDKSFMEAGEISLSYNLGQGDLSATEEKRELQKAYSTALGRVYKIFDASRSYENLINVQYINCHPNEVLTVDSDLYAALALLETYGDRSVYLAPIQARYRNLFACTDDVAAASCDPRKDEGVRSFVAELSSFAGDPESIRVELLGKDQIRLTVSETYLAYAAEMELEALLDFSWLMNAFVVDAVADELIAKGYTRGFLSSYDGYTRYLDAADNVYAIRIVDRVGKNVYPAAEAVCKDVSSLVQLRDYPLNSLAASDYYGYADGSYASRYVGSDGLYRAALSDLTVYSASKCCAEVALTLAPIFIADELDETSASSAADAGIFAVWCRDYVIHYTAAELPFSNLYSDDAVRYSLMPRTGNE